jgi:hypothetical protein
MEEIVNRVANSSLLTLDLADYYPSGERVAFDLAPWLFRGLILKETDFRNQVKQHDWSQYQGQHIAIGCSADAIVPVWAYMLVSLHLAPFAKSLVFGTLETLEAMLFQQRLSAIDPEAFRGKRVVVKGCGEVPIPAAAFVEISRKLQPVVASLMYGEPCSTVPLFKQAKPISKGENPLQ